MGMSDREMRRYILYIISQLNIWFYLPKEVEIEGRDKINAKSA
jgi:hypothetical protein